MNCLNCLRFGKNRLYVNTNLVCVCVCVCVCVRVGVCMCVCVWVFILCLWLFCLEEKGETFLNFKYETDQSDLTDWMTFLQSHLMEEISPNPDALSGNTWSLSSTWKSLKDRNGWKKYVKIYLYTNKTSNFPFDIYFSFFQPFRTQWNSNMCNKNEWKS